MKIVTMGVLMALSSSGCVTSTNRPAPKSGPKPIETAGLRQFNGVFGNWSADSSAGQTGGRGTSLFEFMANRSSEPGKNGTEVSIRCSPDGAKLRIGIFDANRREVDFVELRRGVDFQMAKGGLALQGSASGTHAKSSNLAGYWEHRSRQLFVVSTGALLGKRSERSVGFLFYLSPFAGTTAESMLWPKVPSDDH